MKKKIIILSVLVASVVTGFTIWRTVQSKSIERVFIENKTRSLVVESVKEAGKMNDRSMFEISVRNNYDKPVSIYRFRVSEEFGEKDTVSAVEKGAFVDGWVLKPNEVSVTKFFANSKGKIFLTIASIIFEDGTGDGEIGDLTILQEIRLGVLLAYQKIVSTFRQATKKGESFSSDSVVQSLEKKIEELTDENVPHNSKRGFDMAKNYVKFEIEDARKKGLESNFNLESNINSKLSEIETILARLSANPPSTTSKERRQK